MIEIKLAISICVAAFFFGILICGAIMAVISSKGCDDSFSAGYELGYYRGTEEEKQKHIEWLEKVTDDGR